MLKDRINYLLEITTANIHALIHHKGGKYMKDRQTKKDVDLITTTTQRTKSIATITTTL